MTKILQISKYYYPFLGGIEQVARDISGVLQKMENVEQKIICFNEDASDGQNTCNKNETTHDCIDGVEVIRCGYQMKVSSQAISTTYSKEIDKLMNEYNPDIVILHYPNPFATHFLLKYQKRRFKLVIYWHADITKQKILKRVFYSQNVRLIQRADVILGATPKHINESEFSKYIKNKSRIMPYMINEESLKITEEEINIANKIKEEHRNELIGFFIGRHVPYKGLEYLVQASKILKNENIHFFIAGKGELTDSLKRMASDDSKIEFIGKISDSERRIYLYASDIICFPSITKNEAFGLALAEGMYFGKPAVTFTIPGSGVNYVNINGVTGLECNNSDYKEYADALDKLIVDENLRYKYGEAARKRVLDNFTKEVFYRNFMTLITEL